MKNQQNPFMRLVGFSEMAIYTLMPQLVVLGIILILTIVCKSQRNQSTRVKNCSRIITNFAHMIIEGSFLSMFTQIFMNFKYLLTQDYKDLFNLDFIISFLVSLFIILFYLIYLTKILLLINSHMNKKLLTQYTNLGEDQDSIDSQFVLNNEFYLKQNLMNTKQQALFTVLCQYKKITFSLIIVFGSAWIEMQFILFFIAGSGFFASALVTQPNKSLVYQIIMILISVGILDLIIQCLYLIFLVSSLIDYKEVQDQTLYMVSGNRTFNLILIILTLDLVKALYKLTMLIVEWLFQRKIEKKIKLIKIIDDGKKFQDQIIENQQNSINLQPSDQNNTGELFYYGEDPSNIGVVIKYPFVEQQYGGNRIPITFALGYDGKEFTCENNQL